MKKYLKLAFSILVILLVVACGKDEKKVLNVYTGLEEEYLNTYIEMYKKSHPDIELNIIRDSQGAIAAKVMAEGDNPAADILWGMASINLIQLAEDNKLANLEKEWYGENINPIFIDNISSQPRWVGMTAWTSALTVNKYEIEKKSLNIPKSYTELLDEKYSNEIVMPNPASSGTGYLTVLGWISIFGEEKAWEYMDKLNENIIQYTHSGSAPVKMIIQGEQAVGIGMDSESMRLGNGNDAIVTILPTEGYGWDMEGIGIVAKDNIKPEAIEFFSWALSKDTMEEYSKNIGLVSYNGVETKLQGYPADFKEKLTRIDFKWAAENRDRILKEWERRYGKEK